MEIPTTPVELKSQRPYSVLQILQFGVLACVVLYFGKTLFIPLGFALLISLILYPVCKWMEGKGMNSSIAIFLSIFAITILLSAVAYLFFTQLLEFADEWPAFKAKLEETQTQLSNYIAQKFGVSSEQQVVLFKKYISNSTSQILPVVQNTFYSISESVLFLLLTIVLSTLILSHRRILSTVIQRLLPARLEKTAQEILVETIHAYYGFAKGMLFVYFIVGILNSVGLAIIGIPHPVFFGFTASILTFIPYFGIVIASLLPITVSWVEFNSIWYPLGIVLLFTIVQLLEAYVIFPIVVGRRLKINTLAIIVTVIAGGILWGAAGMILFIPFISIVKLIADRMESLKSLSILLGVEKDTKADRSKSDKK